MKKFMMSLLLLLLPATAMAAEDSPSPSPWRSEASYGEQAASKAGFGVKNLLLGWTELVTEPVEQKSVVGIGQGLGNAVMDTIGGFLHLVTAPVTSIDVPLPEGGTNLLTAESER
jgi:hypothetical protein